MTSPPSPPNRRRRRIVVVTIAVLVLGLGWWFWPRVDQRFVGRWYFPLSDAHGRSSFDFSPDGTATVLYSDGRPTPDYARMKWWTEGDNLVIQIVGDSRWRQLHLNIIIFIQRLRGLPEPWDIYRYQIVERDSNRVVLRLIPHAGQATESDWSLHRGAPQ